MHHERDLSSFGHDDLVRLEEVEQARTKLDWQEWPVVLGYSSVVAALIYGLIVSGPLIDAVFGIPRP